jgi:hypothetical protein
MKRFFAIADAPEVKDADNSSAVPRSYTRNRRGKIPAAALLRRNLWHCRGQKAVLRFGARRPSMLDRRTLLASAAAVLALSTG